MKFLLSFVFSVELQYNRNYILFSHYGGRGGKPWDQIMENEFEYLSDRGGHGGHSTKNFFEIILFLSQDFLATVLRFGCSSNKRDYLKMRFFDLQMLIT